MENEKPDERVSDEFLRRRFATTGFTDAIFAPFSSPDRPGTPPFDARILMMKGDFVSAGGSQIVHVDVEAPDLDARLQQAVRDLVDAYVEGRASLRSKWNDEMVQLDLANLILDANDGAPEIGMNDDVFSSYLPFAFLFDLAAGLRAKYRVDVVAVLGGRPSLLFRPPFGAHFRPDMDTIPGQITPWSRRQD